MIKENYLEMKCNWTVTRYARFNLFKIQTSNKLQHKTKQKTDLLEHKLLIQEHIVHLLMIAQQLLRKVLSEPYISKYVHLIS